MASGAFSALSTEPGCRSQSLTFVDHRMYGLVGLEGSYNTDVKRYRVELQRRRLAI